MSCWHGLADHRLGGVVLPNFNWLKFAPNNTFFAPEHLQGNVQFFVTVFTVMNQINGCCRAIIFTIGVDAFGVFERFKIGVFSLTKFMAA